VRPLDEIENDAAAAQPGPWSRVPTDPSNIIDDNGFHVCRTIEPSEGIDHEAMFILHARTDVPALCAEVRRLRALVRRKRIQRGPK
jgi:hypothetical protein